VRKDRVDRQDDILDLRLEDSRANSAQIRQTRPDSSLGLSHVQYESLENMQVVPFSLGSGPEPERQWSGPRANMEHARQSRPDSGVGSQVKVLKTLQCVPFSVGSVLNLRTTTSQKCAAVPRRARI